MDTIEIHNLEVRTILGRDSWDRTKKQPVLITVKVQASVAEAGRYDRVTDSVHYGKLCKAIEKFAESQAHKCMEELAENVADICFSLKADMVMGVFVTIKKRKTFLRAKYGQVEIYRAQKKEIGQYEKFREIALKSAGELVGEDLVSVIDLKLSVILGVNTWERYEKQNILVGMTIHVEKNEEKELGQSQGFVIKKNQDIRKLVDRVSKYTEERTNYLTVEALAVAIARVAIMEHKVNKITVSIKKPSALMFAECSAVTITRTREQIIGSLVSASNSEAGEREANEEVSSVVVAEDIIKKMDNDSTACQDKTLEGSSISYIGVGSNLGDRLKNINDALKTINESKHSKVVDTGFLYQTSPMYVLDQPAFLNTAFKIETTLSPQELLDFLKGIEADLGRDFSMMRFGPRVIDLDILFYEDLVYETERLTIPHPRVHERKFQLQPVCDMNPRLVHNKLNMEVGLICRRLTTHSNVPDDIQQVMPISRNEFTSCIGNGVHGTSSNEEKSVIRGSNKGLFTLGRAQNETLIMGILNFTPDSFSDGGNFNNLDIAVEHALSMWEDGASIIDIGGQSTNPKVKEIISTDEEIRRVVPVVEKIKSKSQGIVVSIDTFNSEVARKALEAGADIINDVSGGEIDKSMFNVVAEHGCPVVLMHMRGTPQTMFSKVNTDYNRPKIGLSSTGDQEHTLENKEQDQEQEQEEIVTLITCVKLELSHRVKNALRAGIPRYNIILDPGIGFSKNKKQNFQIMKNLDLLFKNDSHIFDYHNNYNHCTQMLQLLSKVSIENFPVLLGTSRKAFLQNNNEPKDRVWATAATVTAAIQNHVTIVRIHDVKELKDVVRISDLIYR
ncbi:Folic acid synthesis protein fol1 [Zancudomyces culisetae]|uniref:Folic acid synthesis protein fol1 n=1 Tax=Zancudomyces culisetae TaxID=1213189 RepID=A0A1R1PKW1_ZANCU|nr:Folic acid synthesis protein fol1 [Zancudomyces culisetae]|eukprot:OMH81563.1 Folic acid synthesis protein fol1 [Zancudomyces culisetae]